MQVERRIEGEDVLRRKEVGWLLLLSATVVAAKGESSGCLIFLVVVGGLAAVAFLLKLGESARRAPGANPDRRNATMVQHQETTAMATSDHDFYYFEIASRSRLDTDPDSVWVPVGGSAQVAGFELTGGLLYVGSNLAAADSTWLVEASLIDPALPVAPSVPRDTGERTPYWVRYDYLEPVQRRRYLDWLARGRSDAGVAVAYAFLYFYGLERRYLADGKVSAKARAESQTLLDEIERLHRLFGHDPSFAGYSSALLTFAAVRAGCAVAIEEPSFEPSGGAELSFKVRHAVGTFVGRGDPIPAEWALAWYVGSPTTWLRTPAQRCWDLFRRLFVLRYRERFGAGLKVRPGKTRLELSYRPANPGLREVRSGALDLPEVGVLSAPLRTFGEVVDGATSELAAYSRWVGRTGEDEPRLPGLALLPAELVAGIDDPELDRLQKRLESEVGEKKRCRIETDLLFEHWPTARPDRMSKKEATHLVQLLEHLGFGLEPDVRFGGPPLRSGGSAVLFRSPPWAPAAPTPEYQSSSLVLHLAAMVATGDGAASETEAKHLEAHLEAGPGIGPEERPRLEAHLAWLLAEAPGTAGLKQRVAGLSEEQRAGLARFCVAVAGADGRIEASEVKTLGRIYTLLRLDADRVYTDLHQLGAAGAPAILTAVDQPIVVREARPGEPGIPVPPGPPEPGAGFALDPERVRRRLEESEASRRLLAEVFRDDEEEPQGLVLAEAPEVPESPEEPAALGSAGPTLPGLDASHTLLLHRLVEEDSCSRVRLEEIAEALGLFPDAALDRLNDAAFELCGEPLIEGDDPLEINRGVLEEIGS